MKKVALVLVSLMVIPLSAHACTYDHIKVKNGEVVARWIPCNDESCPDYQRHKRMIENQNVVYVHDASQDTPQEETAGSAGKVYDKAEHRERNVEAISAEKEAINKATNQPVVIVEEKKKEDTVVDKIKNFFGF